MIKRIFSLILCFIIILSLVACGNKDGTTSKVNPQDSVIFLPEEDDENNSFNTQTTTKPNDNVTNQEETQPQKPNNNQDGTIQLSQFSDDDKKFVGFEEKIEKVLETSDWFAFYSNGSIYHTERDSSVDPWVYYLHEFRIGEIDDIVFYHWNKNSNIVGFVSDEICAYTKPGEENNVYLSVTSRSEDERYSPAYEIPVGCTPDEFKFAWRDVDNVFLVFLHEGQLVCAEFDCTTNSAIGASILSGKNTNDEIVLLKTIESNDFDTYVIDNNDTCYLIDEHFGDLIYEDNGKYYVDLHDKMIIDDIAGVLSYASDNIFIKTNDTDNLHSYIYTSDGIKHVTVKLPSGFKTSDITEAWEMNHNYVVEFNDSHYYVFNEINSLTTKEVVEMEQIKLPQLEYNVVDFAYEDFEILVLLSDGNLYVCEDVA